MSSQVTERNAQKISKDYEGTEFTLAEVEEKTGLSKGEAWRAINYLKSQRRIESRRAGVYYLRTVESTIEQEDRESPAVSDAPAPEESPAPSETPAALEIIPAIFDYSALDVDTSSYLQVREVKIKDLVKNTARNAIDIGRTLAEAKEKLPHGQFGDWCQTALQINPMMASRFMRVAAKFNNLISLDAIAPSALYLLASSTTPDEIVEDVIGRAEAGEEITHKTVKDAVDAAKPQTEEPPAQPDTITGMDGKTYHAAQPISETQTRRDADRIYREFAGVRTSSDIIADRLSIRDERAVKALMLLTAEGKVHKVADIGQATPSKPGSALYSFAPLADESTPPVENILDLSQRVIALLLPREDGLTYEQLCDELKIKPTDPAVPPLRAALDTLFGQQTITKVEGGRITLTRKGLREAGPISVEPTADSTPPAGDLEPERPAYQAIPGSGSPTESSGALTLQVAIDLIIDALRQSERPLGRGELRKYAGIREEDREACEQAIDAMLEAGSLAEVQDGKAGRRYHFPDMLAKLGKGDGVETHRAFVNALRDLTDEAIALAEQPYDPAALHLDAVQVAGTRSAIADAVQHIMALTVRMGEIDAALAALETSSETSANEEVSA